MYHFFYIDRREALISKWIYDVRNILEQLPFYEDSLSNYLKIEKEYVLFIWAWVCMCMYTHIHTHIYRHAQLL